MGRPFTASDDEILDAAGRVIARRGPEGFSIAAVAADLGLSRAAIILRFKSTQALKVTLLNRLVEKFAAALQTLPQTASGDNVLRLGAFIGGHLRSRESLASFFSTYTTNLRDPELLDLERQRGQLLRDAISRVMPEVAIDHSAAVNTFAAHLSGTIMAWLGDEDEDSRRYLLMRTRDWLVLAGISFNKEVISELLQEPRGSRHHDTSVQLPRRKKKTVRSTRPTSR
jgi:TetR/AcrR family macrolide resistance operon transcriptional repressor